MWWLLGNNEPKKAKVHRSSRAGNSSTHSTAYGGSSSLEQQIQEMIQGLPTDLKKNSLCGREASPLCDLHWSLNHYLVDDILRLVKREVTTHFRQLDAYPGLVDPMEAEILHRLRALKGLWTKPSPDGPIAPNAWPFQINRCAACILARIASDKDALRNLRVVIQSRTRTRKNHRPRELNIFVDHCINRLDPAEAEELHTTANQLAFGMKRARKACVKAYIRDRENDPEWQTRRKRRHHSRRADHVKRPVSAENLVLTPTLIPYPLTMYHLRDSGSLPPSDSCGDNRRRRSDAPSPESPCCKRTRTLRLPHHPGSEVIFSEVKWGNLAEQSEKVTMYRKIAAENPYFRATPVPEAMVNPLGVYMTRRYSESSLAFFRPVVCALHGDSVEKGNDIASGSVSDWTDDESDDLDCNVPRRRGAVSTDTTWSLLREHHNLI